MIKIIKQFLTQEEIITLNRWTLINYKQPFFEDAEMDLYYEKTRFTTRLDPTKPHHHASNIEYPQEAFSIQERIQDKLQIINPIYPPFFPFGIVNGIGFNNGSILQHRDPQYYSNTFTLHCNFITQKPENGGVTVINQKEYDIEEGDMLMYVVSELDHEVTKIIGFKSRILWCYGFCVEKDKIQKIFDL